MGTVDSTNAAQLTPPQILYGDLFVEVQTRRLFADGKTFVDAVPRRSVAELIHEFARVPRTDRAIKAFVEQNFDLSLPLTPLIDLDLSGTLHVSMRGRIRQLWPSMVRRPTRSASGASLLDVPAPYVVPGGRFREIYYWDTYFTMIGLAADGYHELIEALLDNFVFLIETYGRIPNGTRSYFLSRSQPPVFYLMCALSKSRDRRVLARRFAAMVTEHDFWMKGVHDCAPGSSNARIVRFADGATLNRYWDDVSSPRDESYFEDISVARKSDRAPEEVYRDLRAGAESGWDFSSRWLDAPPSLHSIKTTAIVPVDLNSLLFGLEREIARQAVASGAVSQSRVYSLLAEQRRSAMDMYCWSDAKARYVDYDWVEAKPTASVTAALLFPLFVGLANKSQAAATAGLTQRELLARGGLRTSTVTTSEQWDCPNGWAPLQWIAVAGLEQYGFHALARTIAKRWIVTVSHEYAKSRRMLEKYNIEENKPGGGGEYPLQDGFGWTNGVTAALHDWLNAQDDSAEASEIDR